MKRSTFASWRTNLPDKNDNCFVAFDKHFVAFDIRFVVYHKQRLQLYLTEQDDVIVLCLLLPNLGGLQYNP